MALNFKGIEESFGGYALTDQLLTNLKMWLDHGLLNQGAYGTVQIGHGSLYSDDESYLRLADEAGFYRGQVWEGFGREWVWESGISIQDPPFRVSGVYVNGDFHPASERGAFAHHIDYQNGRVIFDNPQSPNAQIQAEYCYRMVTVASADHPEFRELIQMGLQEFADNPFPSGTPERDHQVWLPAIFLDVERGSQRGLELGGGQIKTRSVILHVFADRIGDRNLLADWLDYQSRTAFVMADMNTASMPFDHYGDVVSGAGNWVSMASSHPWRKLRILDGKLRKLPSLNPNLFRARIEWEAEIDMPGV